MPRDFDESENGEYIDDLVPINMQMTIHHRYYLTKNISASPHLTFEEREELTNAIFGNDQTDSTHRYR